VILENTQNNLNASLVFDVKSVSPIDLKIYFPVPLPNPSNPSNSSNSSY
jgi:hypothetical protein